MGNYALSRFTSPNAGVTVSEAGTDISTTAALGQAIQNLDTNAASLTAAGTWTVAQAFNGGFTTVAGTQFGSPTGGDKGAGTINAAGGLYDNGGRVSQVLIADTLLGASATNITFSSIPATFKHLRLVFSGRGDGAVANDLVRAQFNADTGANYVGDYNTASGTSAPTSSTVNTTSLVAGEVGGASDAAGAAGLGRLEILDYASATLWKVCEMAGGAPNQEVARNGVMTWKSTAAITSIKLFPTTSTNFVAGTRATLYGMN